MESGSKRGFFEEKIDFLCCRCRCCRSCCCCWSCCCCRCWCCCCCCCATSFSFSSSFCERRPTLKLLDCHDFRKRGRSHEVTRLWITSAVVVVESNPWRCGKSSENAALPTFGLELFRWQQFSRFFISFLKMSPFIFLVALLSYLFVVHPDGLWPSSEMSATLWNNNKILLWAKKGFVCDRRRLRRRRRRWDRRRLEKLLLLLLLLLSLKAKKWKTLLSSFLQKKRKETKVVGAVFVLKWFLFFCLFQPSVFLSFSFKWNPSLKDFYSSQKTNVCFRWTLVALL